MKRLAILLALAATPALAASDWASPDQLVQLPDGRQMNIYCAGRGKVTVILEAGFQAWSFSWSTAQARLEQKYRVCSYDRAGLGFSDPGPYPRDGAAITRDLDALITAAKLKPPFILVGHSAGGLSVRLLADRRPTDVIGLVLVDPSVEGQFAGREDSVKATAAGWYRCADAVQPGKAPADAKPCAPPVFAWMPPGMAAEITRRSRGPDYWRTLGSEYESIFTTTSAAILAGRQWYGAMPVVVLTAGKNLDPRWAAKHAAIAARSSNGVHHIIPEAGHILQSERPDAVADAVDEVVALHRAAGVEPQAPKR